MNFMLSIIVSQMSGCNVASFRENKMSGYVEKNLEIHVSVLVYSFLMKIKCSINISRGYED